MKTTVATTADQSRTTDTGADQAEQTESLWHEGIDFERYDTIEYVQDHFDDFGVTHRGRFVHDWAVKSAFERVILSVSMLDRGCGYTQEELFQEPNFWRALRPHARREVERGMRFLADIGALPVRRIKPDVDGVKRYRIL